MFISPRGTSRRSIRLGHCWWRTGAGSRSHSSRTSIWKTSSSRTSFRWVRRRSSSWRGQAEQYGLWWGVCWEQNRIPNSNYQIQPSFPPAFLSKGLFSLGAPPGRPTVYSFSIVSPLSPSLLSHLFTLSISISLNLCTRGETREYKAVRRLIKCVVYF